jgi:antitoxin MazE
MYIHCLSSLSQNEVVSLRARVAKWGNSLGIRIPKAVAEEVGLNDGVEVQVTVSGRNVVLAPAPREYRLDELVTRITRKNRHAETDWGVQVGDESW